MKKSNFNLLKVIFISIMTLTLSSYGHCQHKVEQERTGKIYGDLFLNANYNAQLKQSSFRLNRLHIGYKKNLSEKWYFNGMIESAKEDYEPNGDYKGITDLFEFCMGYKTSVFEGKFGLIGTELNQLQEALWQHRNVDKVFVDKYGFAPTNDFGFLLKYKPLENLSIDYSLTNGEGHKVLQSDSVFRHSLGVTSTLNSGFVLRVYSDFVPTTELIKINMIGIVGYKNERLSFGLEFNQQIGSDNIKNKIKKGFSEYIHLKLDGKFSAFGRHDFIKSNMPEGLNQGWDIENDGNLIITGIQYEIMEAANLSLNYRGWISAQENTDMASYMFLDLAIYF